MKFGFIKILLFFITAVFFVSCASSPKFTKNKSHQTANKTDYSRTRYSKNKPDNKTREDKVNVFHNLPSKSLESVIGYASYYADDFDGKKTANGEVFNMYELTAAHKSYPFNTLLRVTNLSNNKSIIVRINDRGPFVDDRIIDLSLGAAMQLDMLSSGVQKVRLDVIEWGE